MFFQQYCSITVLCILCLFLVVVFSEEETEVRLASIRTLCHIIFFGIGGAIASAHSDEKAVLIPLLFAIGLASISFGISRISQQRFPENMGLDEVREMLEQKK